MKPITDIETFLRGFVQGYHSGYEFGVNPPEEWSEDEGGSAPGSADAPTAAPPLDLASRRCAPAAPAGAPAVASSSGSAASSLPAIRQGALPPGVEVAGDLERLFVHRGMVTGLRVLAEVFRACDMDDAVDICVSVVRGVEVEVEDR